MSSGGDPRVFIHAEFGAFLRDDIVGVSKTEFGLDHKGDLIPLADGVRVTLFDWDADEEDRPTYLLADGVIVPNTFESEGFWGKVKWCCQVDLESFRHELVSAIPGAR